MAAPPASRRRSRIRPARGASNESSTAQVCLPGRSLLGAGLWVALILGNRAPLAAQEDPPALAAQASPYDWLQYNGDPQHTGNNTQETVLGASNVASLQFLFQATLPSVADGAPVYLRNVTTPTGTRDLLFVTTKAGHIIALDAATGTQVWSRQYGPGTCKINNGSSDCYTTSHPAIDPNRLYVYSYGLDGYVHKYQVGDGTEITGGGWPELATTKGFDEKGSSALSFATAVGGATYLYVTNGAIPATTATTRDTSPRSTWPTARSTSSTPPAATRRCISSIPRDARLRLRADGDLGPRRRGLRRRDGPDLHGDRQRHV